MNVILENPMYILATAGAFLLIAILLYIRSQNFSKELSNLKVTINDLQVKLSNTTLEKQALENQANQLLNTIQELNARIQELSFTNNNLDVQAKTLSNKLIQTTELYHSVDARQKELENQLSDIKVLKSDLEKQITDQKNLIATLSKNVIDVNAQYAQAVIEKSQIASEKEQANATIAKLEAQIFANEKINEQIKTQFETSQEKLKEELKNLSEKFVKAGAEDLSKKSQADLINIVNPLKDEIEKFKIMMNENHAAQEKRVGAFENEIKNIQQSSINLSNQAEELTKALRSGSKSQGIWGEQQLERVLESSGLVKDKDYRREVAVMQDSRDATNAGRPDAVVDLPDNHCIVIDAKCSLTAYTKFINATNKEDKVKALKEHTESVRKHVNELKSKGYSENYRKLLNCPYFVFMFVPLDGALSDALSYDSSLYDDAAMSKIYLVSPSSMIPALRVVANLWMLSEQTDRISSLISSAQDIWNKFETVESKLAAVIKLGGQQQKAVLDMANSFNSGKGSLRSKLEKFDKDGARKQILLSDKVSIIEGTATTVEKSAPSIPVNDE